MSPSRVPPGPPWVDPHRAALAPRARPPALVHPRVWEVGSGPRGGHPPVMARLGWRPRPAGVTCRRVPAAPAPGVCSARGVGKPLTPRSSCVGFFCRKGHSSPGQETARPLLALGGFGAVWGSLGQGLRAEGGRGCGAGDLGIAGTQGGLAGGNTGRGKAQSQRSAGKAWREEALPAQGDPSTSRYTEPSPAVPSSAGPGVKEVKEGKGGAARGVSGRVMDTELG